MIRIVVTINAVYGICKVTKNTTNTQHLRHLYLSTFGMLRDNKYTKRKRGKRNRERAKSETPHLRKNKDIVFLPVAERLFN